MVAGLERPSAGSPVAYELAVNALGDVETPGSGSLASARGAAAISPGGGGLQGVGEVGEERLLQTQAWAP